MKLSPNDPRLKKFNFFLEGYDMGRGEFFQSPVGEGTWRKLTEMKGKGIQVNSMSEGRPIEGVMVRARMESEYVKDIPPEEWTI